MSETNPPRRLLVSGRAVARYWGVHHALVAQAERAGLIHKFVVTHDAPGAEPRDDGDPSASGPREGAEPEVVEQGYDASRILDLGRRPFVDPDDLVAFDPESILLVQQTNKRRHVPSEPDWHIRAAYGWHVDMPVRDAVDSARGWWAVDPRRRYGVQAIVSVVSSFAGTLAIVDREKRIELHPDGRVMYPATAADDTTALGRHLIRVFQGRRVPVRQGVSRLVPQIESPTIG